MNTWNYIKINIQNTNNNMFYMNTLYYKKNNNIYNSNYNMNTLYYKKTNNIYNSNHNIFYINTQNC